jgi:hypothetical protein
MLEAESHFPKTAVKTLVFATPLTVVEKEKSSRVTVDALARFAIPTNVKTIIWSVFFVLFIYLFLSLLLF